MQHLHLTVLTCVLGLLSQILATDISTQANDLRHLTPCTTPATCTPECSCFDQTLVDAKILCEKNEKSKRYKPKLNLEDTLQGRSTTVAANREDLTNDKIE